MGGQADEGILLTQELRNGRETVLTTVAQHYDEHLGPIYSWMLGDFELAPGGVFLATFRDYASAPPQGVSRFIPVRSDEKRILTCFLEYHENTVIVHDLVHERDALGWKLKISAYPKLRLDPEWVRAALGRAGLAVASEAGPRGMIRLIGRKP